MSQLGMGVMLNMMFNNTDLDLSEIIGKTIQSIELADDVINVKFDGDKTLELYDSGQSCCESRWITSDADLPYYSGAKFLSMEIREGPDMSGEDSYGEHEAQFLVLITDKGNVDFVTHNEHNGWYGGFSITGRIK